MVLVVIRLVRAMIDQRLEYALMVVILIHPHMLD